MEITKGHQEKHPGSEYSQEQVEFLFALDAYKRKKQKPCLEPKEILAVARALGYRKVAEAVDLPTYKEINGRRRSCNRDDT